VITLERARREEIPDVLQISIADRLRPAQGVEERKCVYRFGSFSLPSL